MGFEWIFFFVIGLLLGSFANVVIVRLPKEESVIHPRSHCTKCNRPIAFYDNIPVFSWLLLRGKCRHCKASISIRYPLVELLVGVLFAAAYLKMGLSWTFLEYLILIFGLVIISFIDIDHYIIPDSFSLGGIVLGLAGSFLNPEREVMPSVYGVLLGGGFLWLIAYLYILIRKTDGMGGGDIKLLAWIGAVLEWQSIPFIILVSSVIGSIVGIYMAARQKSGMKTVLPFGPFIAMAALVYILGGKGWAMDYLQLFFPWLGPGAGP
jgi:leader peptidase (prepilin peptidase)/N-methyltransferase